MLNELLSGNKIVGVKQLRKALKEDAVKQVFLAKDGDPKLTDSIVELTNAKNVDIQWVDTMAILGKACGIDVGALTAALLK